MRSWVLAMATLGWAAGVGAAELHRLEWGPPDAHGWPRLSMVAPSNRVVRLEASSDLVGWVEVGRSHDGLEVFPDPGAEGRSVRYYRAVTVGRTGADDWKNQVWLPGDALLSPPPEFGQVAMRWVKFAIVLAEPHRVYFQDSTKYAFHYEFARARLPGFAGMSRAEFDAVALRRAGQQVVLGAVLVALGAGTDEVGIQVVGAEPYPAEEVARWIELVRACLVLGQGTEAFYFPTFEQEAIAREHRSYFEGRGIRVGSAARWVMDDECYAPGWALGRLVAVSAAELAEAYRAGRVGPGDIVVLDAVPAEVPPVAGIVTRTPATPNSHVALLAQSFGVPFVYLARAEDRERLAAWEGQEVVLRATRSFWGNQVRLVNVEGQLDAGTRSSLLAFKQPEPLDLPAKAMRGQISMDTAVLRPGDTRFVGGKAAHFGLLRRAIPGNAPSPSLAFTFDLWDAFLDQTLPGGGSLRGVIGEKLAPFSWPPEMAALSTALAEVRDLIRRTAEFTPAQEAEILAVLQGAGFSLDRNIRFRSSTNVEDTERFSGAGLYDSYSGCLADELDGDSQGPSACDPTDENERGVFRALRRVYASFYNDNAYLERLRHGIEEATVGMGVLVHPSTPDEFELANGVATVRITKGSQPGDRGFRATLVTQAGAVSVANPDVTARPEEVEVYVWGATTYLELGRGSGLVPLGDHVLVWEHEYKELVALLDAAARAYEAEFPTRRELVLDFEYKKVAPDGKLRVKQIRELPQPATTAVVPWLLHETNRYALVQGEFGDVLGLHRLKSWWRFSALNQRLEQPNPAAPWLGSVEATFREGGALVTRAGRPADLPAYRHGFEGSEWVDGWTWGEGSERRNFELRTWLPATVPASAGPIVFLSDGQLGLSVTYAAPQPALGFEGPTTTTQDYGILAPVTAVSARSLPQMRSWTGRGLRIETRFYWPPPPTGVVAGYTAPLQAWIETRIEGLAAEPVVLRGEWSQTYHPGHHNFYEEFLFDPHLEPGMDPAILAELSSRNIGALIGSVSFDEPGSFWVLGLDQKLRGW